MSSPLPLLATQHMQGAKGAVYLWHIAEVRVARTRVPTVAYYIPSKSFSAAQLCRRHRAL